MDWRNRIGLYGSYFFGMAAVGFILPFLPRYLNDQGLSERAISVVWTLAALASLVQCPIGLWSDHLRWRKPFLVVALAVLAVAAWLLPGAHGVVWVALLAILFAENGPCRAILESLAGAEATHISRPDRVGSGLGALRFWRPVGVVAVALVCVPLVQSVGIQRLLQPLAIVQCLAVATALLLHEEQAPEVAKRNDGPAAKPGRGRGLRDGVLWTFMAATVLFHASAAPGGAYLGLFLRKYLGADDGLLPVAFIVMMVTWMLVVWPAGRLADRIGRRPLLLLGWGAMTVRLALVAVARAPWQVLAAEVLDGLAQGLFAVLAAAWVTDRLGDPRRVGEAQVLVGSALVAGSAAGPMLSFLVLDALGYRGMFGLLACVVAVGTLLLAALVPETLPIRRRCFRRRPGAAEPDLLRSPQRVGQSSGRQALH
jgi:MFS family permease